MMPVEEAAARVLAAIEPLPSETVPLPDSLGRTLATEVLSPIDLPAFDNSAMDGYAVRSADLTSASSEIPSVLRLAGKIAAGEKPLEALAPGSCVRIFTGSPLPAGADAVVMQEDVSVQDGQVRFSETTRPLENVRLQGEDLKAGTLIGRPGERIGATRAAVFAACGVAQIPVSRPPSVALLATGSELREPGATLQPGEIFESNRTLLTSLATAAGCAVTSLPLIQDDLEAVTVALQNAFRQADVVITTGGVSVGEFDFVKDAFSRIGGTIEFWKVAMRPGKPFVFGRKERQLFFGLPGNPVSALVTFLLLVRPALLKLQNRRHLALPRIEGRLETRVHNRGDRRHFVRVRWENGAVRVCGPQASHMIGAMGPANALLDIPPQTCLEANANVSVHLWELPEADSV